MLSLSNKTLSNITKKIANKLGSRSAAIKILKNIVIDGGGQWGLYNYKYAYSTLDERGFILEPKTGFNTLESLTDSICENHLPS